MRGLTFLATTASAALLAGGLTACTPKIRPILALTLQDGAVTALVYGCGGKERLSVEEDPLPPDAAGSVESPAGTPPPTSPGFPPAWMIASDGGVDGLQEARLLGTPPDGWRAEPGGYPSLTRFRAGSEYTVQAHRSYRLQFLGDDLGSLPADQVLTRKDYGDPLTMSRQQFTDQARDSC